MQPCGRQLMLVGVGRALIVNIGDMLERWTNGKFRSTMHRVVTKAQQRYSVRIEGVGMVAVVRDSNDNTDGAGPCFCGAKLRLCGGMPPHMLLAG